MKRAPVGVPTHIPLVHLMRDGLVEGVHHGSVVVLAPDGSVRFRAGDVHTALAPRSAAKPLQAAAMTRLGLSLPPDLLALATASHSGEPFHLDGAQRILDIGGCTEVLRQRTQGESGSASRRGCRWGYAPLLAGQLG